MLKGWGPRRWSSLILIFSFYLVVRGDAISSAMSLAYLCRCPESHNVVYSTVVIDRSYWDDEGWPEFHDRHGAREFNGSIFDNRYEVGWDQNYINYAGIIRKRKFIRDTLTGKFLITKDIYSSIPGWYGGLVNSDTLFGERSCKNSEFYKANQVRGVLYNNYLTSWVFLPSTYQSEK